MKRLLAPLALVVVLASGCGAPGPAKESASSSATQQSAAAIYEFKSGSSVGAVRIPTGADADIESLRKSVGGAAVTYLSARLNNSKGSAPLPMKAVSILTTDGKELKYVIAGDYLNGLRPADANAQLSGRFKESAGRYAREAKPRSVEDFVLVGPAVPKDIAKVMVTAGGAAPVQASLAS